jgi:hypothetical protein
MKTPRVLTISTAVCVLCGALYVRKGEGLHKDVIVSGRIHDREHVHVETTEPVYPFYLQVPGSIVGITGTGSGGTFFQTLPPTSWSGGLES